MADCDTREPLIEARGIHKRFLGVHALDEVTAQFFPGEIAAVMGENGAGKSTLMKCLAGVYQPDEGSIVIDGKITTVPNVNRATELGIAFIHQELNLADNLSVGANIFLGREPKSLGPLGFIDRGSIRKRTQELLKQLGMSFNADTRVEDLSIGHQQMVEIAKALSQDARLLIMDEPTSSLTQHETDALFKLVERLRDDGMCIVFISHRLAEVEKIAERVIVLRDGRNSGNLAKHEINHDAIVSLMIGRELALHDKGAVDPGKAILEVDQLRVPSSSDDPISFRLRAGEIVGMAGLVGAGRTELARAIFGIDRHLGGTIKIDGKPVAIKNPRDAIKAGIAFVPEDRKAQGVILEMTIRDNVVMAGIDRYQKAGFVRNRQMTAVAERARSDLGIKTPTVAKEVGLLSGGNQQKVVLAKWISLRPRVFLLDEPTRGVDVGSKSEIYKVIEKMAAEGAAVLFISSEMEEVLRISDRVLVMHEGKISGELSREELDEESIMQLATGT
jgi:ribose transport system ATP-binding protein